MGLLSSLFGQKKPAKSANNKMDELVRKASSGDLPSILELGRNCRKGVVTGLSREEVGGLLEKAAAQGSGEAMGILGDLYRPSTLFKIRADAQTALSWYEKACAAGYTDAACEAGRLFMGICGTEKNYAKAKHYFRLGYKAGNILCARELGRFYDTGKGGEKNLEKAIECYNLAVAGGDYAACFHLGDLYYFGRGVAKDLSKAAALYQQSKAKNYADAEAMLDFMMLKGELPLKGSDEEVFRHLLRLAEGFSQNRANFVLGLFFETGTFVDQDLEKAIRYYEKSAKTGNLAAMRKVSLLEKADFPGHRPDFDKAHHWEMRFREELGN